MKRGDSQSGRRDTRKIETQHTGTNKARKNRTAKMRKIGRDKDRLRASNQIDRKRAIGKEGNSRWETKKETKRSREEEGKRGGDKDKKIEREKARKRRRQARTM